MITPTASPEPSAPIVNAPPPDRQYFSTGHLACRFQVPVQTVRRVLAAAEIVPAFHLNEVEYWDGYAMLCLARSMAHE